MYALSQRKPAMEGTASGGAGRGYSSRCGKSQEGETTVLSTPRKQVHLITSFIFNVHFIKYIVAVDITRLFITKNIILGF